MRALVLGLTTLAVAAAPAAGSAPRAQAAAASTQRPATAVVRARCANCGDSLRRVLIIRLDSLRSEFERRSLTNEQNEVLTREMTETLVSLQRFFEEGGGPRRRAAPQGGEVAAYSFQFQTGPKRGYLGVIFDGPSTDITTDRDRIIRFYQYPRIASVDPSSPAERAGILVGDTVIAFNGIDVVDRAFSLAKMLVPNEKFTMKVNRQGDAKEFRIVVGEIPSYAIARAMPMPAAVAVTPGVSVAPFQVSPAQPTVQTNVRAPVATARTPYPPEPAEAPAAPVSPRIYFLGNGVAGARFEVLNSANERLGKLLGTKEGLLVISVSPGSPADRWRLRDGDVILSADGEPMRTFSAFRRVVADMDRSGEAVTLVVLREKKKVDIAIR